MKKLILIILILLISLSIINTVTISAADFTLYSHWELLPRYVRMNTWTEINTNNMFLQFGYVTEGRQHDSDDQQEIIDPLNITYTVDDILFKGGIFTPRWGTDNFNSIMLSGNTPGLPGFLYRTNIHNMEYERFVSWFEIERGKLFGHRLEIEFSEGIKVGLKETVIYSEEFEGFWLNYVPFYPFYLIKYIPAPPTRTHNMNIGIDFTLDRFNNFELYGDFHVSEWPLVPESNQPPLYSLKLGAYHKNIFNNISLKLEYQRIMNYIYSTHTEEQFYHYQDKSMGSELGPDAEQLDVELGFQINNELRIYGGVKAGRKGEGELGDYWDNIDEAHDNLFMSGIVEKRLSPTIGAKYQVGPNLSLTGRAEMQFAENFDHEQDKTGTRTFAHLFFSWNL